MDIIEKLKIDKEICRKYLGMDFSSFEEFDQAIQAIKEKEKMNTKTKIRISYKSNNIDKLTFIDGKSDWIDLHAAERVEMKAGDFRLISLGVAIELPEGYEAHIVPRSSTFKNFGILQANSMGIVDESYCGNNDIWKFPALAMRDTVVEINDRICQFRIERHQPPIEFVEVEELAGKDRGGFGSTGK